MCRVSRCILVFAGMTTCSESLQFPGTETNQAATRLMGGHQWYRYYCVALLNRRNCYGNIAMQAKIDDNDENPLILEAKQIIHTNLGIEAPSLLSDDNFVWINPFVDEPVGKRDYVAAGTFFNLRSTFPDLDFRCYDFRVDAEDSFTIRCTCRVTGTMLGGFQLRNVVVPPNGKTMICPPEGISMTFDPVTMKVTKLCTGFALDRQVGNTGGLTGVQAASLIAAKPMASWKNLPFATAYSEVYSQRPKRLENPQKGDSSPFPGTVMIQLARGVLTSSMGADDPSLLSDDEFFYVTPDSGPVLKSEYLRHYAEHELDGYEPNFSYIRVDPYEPDRVWIDSRPKAAGFRGPPQVLSVSFDRNGYCSRITTSAVLDPSIGNTGGLGGAEGYKYVMSRAGAVRPMRRDVETLSPSTNSMDEDVDADDDNTLDLVRTKINRSHPVNVREAGSATVKNTPEVKTPARPNIPPPIEKMAIVKDFPESLAIEPESDVTRNRPEPQAISQKGSDSTLPNNPPLEKIALGNNSLNKVSSISASPRTPVLPSPMAPSTFDDDGRSSPSMKPRMEPKLEVKKSQLGNTGISLDHVTASIRIPDYGFRVSTEHASKRTTKDGVDENSVVKKLERLKDITESISTVPKQISRSFSLLMDHKTQEGKAAAEARRQEATAKRRAQLKGPSALNMKHTKPLPKDATFELVRNPSRLDREDLLASMKKRKDESSRRDLKRRSSGSVQDFASSVFGIAGVDAATKPASIAVPRLARWEQNPDGSITGYISGTPQYRRNEKITTSPVRRGRIASGEVVRTGSGSRYFLE